MSMNVYLTMSAIISGTVFSSDQEICFVWEQMQTCVLAKTNN